MNSDLTSEQPVWFVQIGTERFGPMTLSQAKARVANTANPTFVWKEGFPGWKAVAEVPEFASSQGGSANTDFALEANESDLAGLKVEVNRNAAPVQAAAESGGVQIKAVSVGEASQQGEGASTPKGVSNLVAGLQKDLSGKQPESRRARQEIAPVGPDGMNQFDFGHVPKTRKQNPPTLITAVIFLLGIGGFLHSNGYFEVKAKHAVLSMNCSLQARSARGISTLVRWETRILGSQFLLMNKSTSETWFFDGAVLKRKLGNRAAQISTRKSTDLVFWKPSFDAGTKGKSTKLAGRPVQLLEKKIAVKDRIENTREWIDADLNIVLKRSRKITKGKRLVSRNSLRCDKLVVGEPGAATLEWRD